MHIHITIDILIISKINRYIVYSMRKLCLYWGCSSIGRALASHARGKGIEAPQLHIFFGFFFFNFPFSGFFYYYSFSINKDI